jgi:hypothetical protein
MLCSRLCELNFFFLIRDGENNAGKTCVSWLIRGDRRARERRNVAVVFV